jgi:hypothetical protein
LDADKYLGSSYLILKQNKGDFYGGVMDFSVSGTQDVQLASEGGKEAT